MRTLAFAPGSNLYKLLYQAVIVGPTKIEKPDLKAHVRLVTALESVGTRDERTLPTGDNPDPVPLYNLNANGGSVRVEEDSFTLLRRMFNDTVPAFHKSQSRAVVACDDWLAAIPEDSAPKPALVKDDAPTVVDSAD